MGNSSTKPAGPRPSAGTSASAGEAEREWGRAPVGWAGWGGWRGVAEGEQQHEAGRPELFRGYLGQRVSDEVLDAGAGKEDVSPHPRQVGLSEGLELLVNDGGEGE